MTGCRALPEQTVLLTEQGDYTGGQPGKGRGAVRA
jgi:hypothetical protein